MKTALASLSRKDVLAARRALLAMAERLQRGRPTPARTPRTRSR